ncbi:hypothetical protein EDB92DRAFT_1856868 [Lactarius akahatsu]|uniref:Peptidase S53 activation domain-containing protein n=1 Tax=Lactarius akahatsu TaxID=416441 RepID=A0AAD4LI55_9AGAM|nr:hypothetical protein EDB92DRAFT_1856868 [Lactarius akahatsu]
MLKDVSVTQANTLLGASYKLYRHIERGETIVRTVGYSLPMALHWHVLTTPRNRSDRAVKSTYIGRTVMMLSSRAIVNYLYDTETYIPDTRGENVLGIVGFLGDYPSPADLTAFMQKYRSEADDATFTVVKVNDGEANMDIQYTEAMAYPTPHIFYSTGLGSDTETDDDLNIPQIISMSYSNEENFTPRELQ